MYYVPILSFDFCYLYFDVFIIYHFFMRPRRHSVGGSESSFTMTNSLGLRFCCSIFYFTILCSSVIYSFFQRLDKIC